ncbi:MAG: hypothetical protein HZC36_08245 [Armatimonadetes bacterium]|nr:hypothetical protein [Armatimonadota bacterium]
MRYLELKNPGIMTRGASDVIAGNDLSSMLGAYGCYKGPYNRLLQTTPRIDPHARRGFWASEDFTTPVTADPVDIRDYLCSIRPLIYEDVVFANLADFESNANTVRVPQEIEEEIERSKYMLDFAENWDAEGSPAYKKTTWERAVKFLRKEARALWKATGLNLPAPEINHGPQGSVDIDWTVGDRALLVNIPEDSKSPCVYYGRSNCGDARGRICLEKSNASLLQWLLLD